MRRPHGASGLLRALGVVFFVTLPFAASAEAEAPGQRLFREKGCTGCHSIGGEGGQLGPALDHVGDRYSPEWMYTWLRDPAAVKPGTLMPKLPLTDDERALLVFFLIQLRSSDAPPAQAVAGGADVPANTPELNPQAPENEYLKLGTEKSFVRTERNTIQDQVQTFIPPLYEPAFTQSAFVLPPGALRVEATFRNVGTIDESDVDGERELGARVRDFDLERRFYDLDLLLGLDHNFTVRLNVPVLTSHIEAELNPGFFDPVTVFPEGSTTELGDLVLFLKKKLFDQGNFPFGLAGVGAIRLPTGSDDERFSRRVTARTPMGDGLVGGDGIFRRFSDDGRLPASLQPGLGTVGGSLGLFATRQFEGSTFLGRGAVHTGALYELRPQHDGIDPGNVLTYFATFVKPLYEDKLSFDFTYLLSDQQEDSYAGQVLVPTAMGPVLVDRPSFTGGTTQFIGTSLIFAPNPLFRFTATGLYRVAEPRLGPSPPWLFRVGLAYTFASGLFQSGDRE